MKISLQIECDSLDDFQRVMATLGTSTVTDAAPVKAVLETLEIVPPPEVKETPATIVEPVVPVEEEQPIPAPPEPIRAKRRGRPAKAAREAPAPVAAAPVATSTQTPDMNGTSLSPVPASRDDLLDVFGAYVKKFGTNAGYNDVSKLLQESFGAGVRKASDVTDDNVATAVAVVRKAIETNPFNRKRADVQ